MAGSTIAMMSQSQGMAQKGGKVANDSLGRHSGGISYAQTPHPNDLPAVPAAAVERSLSAGQSIAESSISRPRSGPGAIGGVIEARDRDATVAPDQELEALKAILLREGYLHRLEEVS